MSLLSIDLTTQALIRALQWRKMEAENAPIRPQPKDKASNQKISTQKISDQETSDQENSQ